jgi:hypothetical protein
MTDDQDSHAVSYESKEEVVRESGKIHAPKIVATNDVGFRRFSGLLKIQLKFRIELIGKLWSCDLLVVSHNARNVRVNLVVEFQPH